MDKNIEEVLIEEAKKGCPRSFEKLYNEHWEHVWNTIRSIFPGLCDEQITDCVSDAFVRAYQKLSWFRGESLFYTWVSRIAYYCACDEHKRMRRMVVVSIDDQEALSQLANSTSATGAKFTLTSVTRVVINDALMELTPAQRAVVILKDVEGLEYAEIAEALEIPVGTVKSRLNAARARLRAILGDWTE